MTELVLRSNIVVTPDGVRGHDVAISGGRITALAPYGTLSAPHGGRLIDMTGRMADAVPRWRRAAADHGG